MAASRGGVSCQLFLSFAGNRLNFSELGVDLYSGCAVGCRYCSDPWVRRMTWERWTSDARPRKNILSELKRDAKKMEGDPREIIVCPGPDPYQSEEAARLTRKALLILEQYHLRVHVATQCGMRSVADFDILARNHWKYGTRFFFSRKGCARSGSPAPRQSPSASRRCAKPMRRESLLGSSSHPAAYPAELIDVVESLRADVDAWKIGKPLPGEPPPKPNAGRTSRLRRRRNRFGLSSPYGRERLEREAAYVRTR